MRKRGPWTRLGVRVEKESWECFHFEVRCLYAGLAFFVWLNESRAEELTQSEKTTNRAEETKSNQSVRPNFVEIAQKGIQLSGYVDESYRYDFSSNNIETNDFIRKQDSNPYNLYAIKLALEEALASGPVAFSTLTNPQCKKTESGEARDLDKTGVSTNLNFTGPSRLDLNPQRKSLRE